VNNNLQCSIMSEQLITCVYSRFVSVAGLSVKTSERLKCLRTDVEGQITPETVVVRVSVVCIATVCY
jgi:hypothetical protein